MRKVILSLVLILTGCSNALISQSSSTLAIKSLGLDQHVLYANCPTIVCTDGFANEGDIWLTDIPLENLRSGDINKGQIIHLQIMWTPAAGKTPLASTSTNLVIKHVIVSDGQTGVYGGGGYCMPKGTPSTGLDIYVEEATIALQNHSPQFEDLLTPATMVGKVRSTPNKRIANLIAAATQRLTQ